MQLICFGSAVQCTPIIQFLGHSLKFCSAVQYLGHILSHDLADPDIIDKTKNLAKKANYMLHTFSCCDRLAKSTLFMSFCLSFTGSAIWSFACPQLRSLEVTLNNILCKIRGLPHRCHTSLVHLTAALDSVFNTVYVRSLRLVNLAINSDSIILRDVFYQSSKLAYCFAGYNCGFGWKHLKFYSEQYSVFASFMRDVLAYLNSTSLFDDIHSACCALFIFCIFICLCLLCYLLLYSLSSLTLPVIYVFPVHYCFVGVFI